MLEEIIALSESLEAHWDLKSFPDRAFEALSQYQANIKLEEFENEVSDWLGANQSLPEQLNVYNDFGEPPITLFNNSKFAIDLYFWRSNDTVIHSHAFRGAFKVLFGRSLHEDFNLEALESFNDDIRHVNLLSNHKKIMTQVTRR